MPIKRQIGIFLGSKIMPNLPFWNKIRPFWSKSIFTQTARIITEGEKNI